MQAARETRTVVCEVHTASALDRLSARPREVEALSALITRVTSTLDMDEVRKQIAEEDKKTGTA